jgi:hypothetical protein
MTTSSSIALPLSYKLGEYRIQSVLGHGGFGITYLAQDERLGSQVAIKEYFPETFAVRDPAASTIHANASATASDAENYRWGLDAFLQEAQALAKFKHPNIVRVLRFLEANGTAYLVMEYEAGEPLSVWLRRHGGFLDEPMLLSVFLPVLGGLQAVHDAGLLHLDIKPDNIYLRAGGAPLLIDFGSARQFRRGSEASQRVALSRGYAALEQYPDRGERGPWTDLYGVGATLYRCITGKEPADALVREESLARKHVDALVPATRFERPLYSAHIREAVDAATALLASARPQTARALQNGLMGKGVTDEKATPFVPSGRGPGFIGVTTAQEPRRRRRVYRGPLEILLVVLVFLATFAVVIPKLLIDTGRMTEDELYRQVDSWREAAYDADRLISERVFGMKPRSVESAPRPLPRREMPTEPVRPVVPFNTAPATVRTVKVPAAPAALVFVREGAWLAGALDNGMVQVWNAQSGEWVRTLSGENGARGAVAASPDGRWLALTTGGRAVALWDTANDRAPLNLALPPLSVAALAFSANGEWLAVAADDRQLYLWNVVTMQAGSAALSTRAKLLSLGFSPNGRVLSGADDAGGVQSWQIPGAKEMSYFAAHGDAVNALAYAADGKWMATGGNGRFLKLWAIGLDRKDRVLATTLESVEGVAFAPDGRWLLASGSNDAIELWSLEGAADSSIGRAHEHDVRQIVFAPDGRRFATGGDDNTIKIWE